MAEGISGFVVVGVILAGSIAAFVIGAIIGRKKARPKSSNFNQNIKQVEARLASEGSSRKALQNEIDWLKKGERAVHPPVRYVPRGRQAPQLHPVGGRSLLGRRPPGEDAHRRGRDQPLLLQGRPRTSSASPWPSGSSASRPRGSGQSRSARG